MPEKPAATAATDTEEFSGKRRMPESLRKFLLRVQGGKLYLPAAYRVVWFRDECPDWGVTTSIVEGGQEAGFCTVMATVFDAGGRVISNGHKTETRQDFPAGWVEKAETGAIARALALAGFGTQFDGGVDDDSYADAPQPQAGRVNGNGSKPPGAVWDGPGQCPNCHAPAGKPHGKQCLGDPVVSR